MPSLEDLILRAGDVILEEWYLNHYNIHKSIDELLLGVTSVIRYGYVYSSLIPYAPSIVDVGSAYKPFRNIFADYGYFNENAFIQGKRVLKDEDPIYIADVFPVAQRKITYAIDDSYYVRLVLSANEKLADMLLELEALKLKTDQIYERLHETLDVDVLSTESTASDLLRSVATEGEKIIITPSYGKRISSRSWHIQSTSTSGLIALIFPNTGKYIGVLMCARGFWTGNNRCNVYGDVNEPVKLFWEGLSVNSDIFWQVAYKEI